MALAFGIGIWHLAFALSISTGRKGSASPILQSFPHCPVFRSFCPALSSQSLFSELFQNIFPSHRGPPDSSRAN